MTVVDRLNARLERGRRMAESLMTLTLTAYSPSDPLMLDGIRIPGFKVEGTCPGKVQGGTQAGKDTPSRTTTIGGVQRPILEGGLHIPISAFLAPDGRMLMVAGSENVGWELEVSAVGGGADPSLLGRRYLLHEIPPAKSFATARRLNVVELPPKEA